jgi:hypothetical protein
MPCVRIHELTTAWHRRFLDCPRGSLEWLSSIAKHDNRQDNKLALSIGARLLDIASVRLMSWIMYTQNCFEWQGFVIDE